jgi:hypothetical protein
MDNDFVEMIGGLAEGFGLGQIVRRALGGAEAYASGGSTQTDADGDEAVPYVYERVLTRRRTLNVNDR